MPYHSHSIAKMKVLVCLTLLFAVAIANRELCVKDSNCALAAGCVCTSSTSPLPVEETPQFVLLTFDDSVTKQVFEVYYEKIFVDRVNPDGNAIGGTFFVPHEYTDYECVNKLYNAGYEIGTHSITKNYNSDYWAHATVEELFAEFNGQKQILSKYANIPIEDIVGVRTPQFQLAGDKSIDAYTQSGLTYDSSWPTLSKNKLFSYTLDFSSTQQCTTAECPTKSHPGFWINPINNLQGKDDVECNALFGCGMVGTAETIKEWLITEFDKSYTKNRNPFKMLINSVWFTSNDNNWDAFIQFLDHLATLPDVFIVTESQLIEWSKAPAPLGTYTTALVPKAAECIPINCMLNKEEEVRYMQSCVSCPKVYPWLNNPEGE